PRGQALWQFPARGESADPMSELGPQRYELRRMPILTTMYQSPFFERMIDQVKLFDLYDEPRAALHLNREYWDYVPLLMSSMAIDTDDDLKRAWKAILSHPACPESSSIIAADDVEDATLREMLTLFDALPVVDGPAGVVYELAEPEHLAPLRQGWVRGGWADAGLWHPTANPRDVLRVRWTNFFRHNYQEIVRLAARGRAERTPTP